MDVIIHKAPCIKLDTLLIANSGYQLVKIPTIIVVFKNRLMPYTNSNDMIEIGFAS